MASGARGLARGGLVAAADGTLVLMAHARFPAHIGVWLKVEVRVIHCSEQHGVCCETVLALRQSGWKKLTFYEPRTGQPIALVAAIPAR